MRLLRQVNRRRTRHVQSKQEQTASSLSLPTLCPPRRRFCPPRTSRKRHNITSKSKPVAIPSRGRTIPNGLQLQMLQFLDQLHPHLDLARCCLTAAFHLWRALAPQRMKSGKAVSYKFASSFPDQTSYVGPLHTLVRISAPLSIFLTLQITS